MVYAQIVHTKDSAYSACNVAETRLSWGFRSAKPPYMGIGPKIDQKPKAPAFYDNRSNRTE